jgi:uncharacterized Tic20 family protein
MAAVAASEQPSSEMRQLAMIVHLVGLASYALPLTGLIGVLVMYVTAKNDFVRANARAALNMQITWAIFSVICYAIYFSIFFTTFLPAFESRTNTSTPPDFGTFAILFFITALVMLGSIVSGVFNAIGAWKAHLGHRYRYPIAVPFLRDPVFLEPTIAA